MNKEHLRIVEHMNIYIHYSADSMGVALIVQEEYQNQSCYFGKLALLTYLRSVSSFFVASNLQVPILHLRPFINYEKWRSCSENVMIRVLPSCHIGRAFVGCAGCFSE